MLFNTIDFVVFFIFVLAVIAAVQKRRFQHIFLLAASYFFFYYSSNYLLGLLVFSTILDYYAGKKIWEIIKKEEQIQENHNNEDNHSSRKTNLQNNYSKLVSVRRQKKLLLVASLAGNLGLLGFYKYADFAIMQFNILGNYVDLGSHIPLLNLALPIGISFYTFQTISYTVDVYRGKLEPSNSLGEFALFVAFFPQLVAGPILRARQFLPQLREKFKTIKKVGEDFDHYNSSEHIRRRRKSVLSKISIQSSNLKLGITIMAFGFLKKMLFADNIDPFVDQIFSNPVGAESFTIILGALAFGIQIYADFSGYTDIAIGAATILGFKIPINFNKPYFATSPSDFWQRWHISLSSWLRDYLYIPLGGNRMSKGRTYLNLYVVMFLGGLWHGASWNFVVWGVMHGTYLTIYRAVDNAFPQIRKLGFMHSRVGKILSIVVTQYLVFLAWIAFRVRDVDFMIYSLQKFVIVDFETSQTLDVLSSNKISVFLIGLFFILNFISYRKQNLHEKIAGLRLVSWAAILMSIAISIMILYTGHPEDFIYFKF